MSSSSIAVIPARANSKRVPRKNIRLFLGKPIIAYTIEAALTSGLFARVIVSTDSEEYAEIARQFGAETPFLRGDALAGDHVPISAVTVDVLERLDPDGSLYPDVCQLMANCPLRTAEDIQDSYRQFRESEARTQISVTRSGWLNPWWAMTRDDQYHLEPIFKEALTQRSQDLPALFVPTGAVWWAKSAVLRQEKTFHTPDRRGWEIPWFRAVDIDDEDDWLLAKALMQVRTMEE
ncbi:MAG TPA: acylneuraminate cytidylyltransferase family protein [Anaerolineaceae bacterium]